MAPLWLIPAVLSLAVAAVPQDDQATSESTAISCGAPPARQVVCYWEGVAPLNALDACMCSQVIFLRGSEYATDNVTLQLLPEVRVASQALRRRNPELRTLVRIPVTSADAKSPVRRQRLADALVSMVRKGGLHGAEIVLEEQNEEDKIIVPRAALTATVQVLRSQLDVLSSSLSTADSSSGQFRVPRRSRRSYDVTERQVEDEQPATWRPALRRNRPLLRTAVADNVDDSHIASPSEPSVSAASTRGQVALSLAKPNYRYLALQSTVKSRSCFKKQRFRTSI